MQGVTQANGALAELEAQVRRDTAAIGQMEDKLAEAGKGAASPAASPAASGAPDAAGGAGGGAAAAAAKEAGEAAEAAKGPIDGLGSSLASTGQSALTLPGPLGQIQKALGGLGPE